MKNLTVCVVVMSLSSCLYAQGTWQQCCTDHWLRRISAPGRSDPNIKEAVMVAYTLPTGGIMALPYGLDPAKLARDEVIRKASDSYRAQPGAPLFIAANVPLDKEYSYDAATYSMFSTVETIGQLCGADPNFIAKVHQDKGWRSFIEVMTVELVSTHDGLVSTRTNLEWVEVLGTVPFSYDPNKFNDPPERQLWDPQHESDRAFHIAWQAMMRWPSGEGLTVPADSPEKKPYSQTRYKGTQLATLRFTVPDAQLWKRWNPASSGKATNKEP